MEGAKRGEKNKGRSNVEKRDVEISPKQKAV